MPFPRDVGSPRCLTSTTTTSPSSWTPGTPSTTVARPTGWTRGTPRRNGRGDGPVGHHRPGGSPEREPRRAAGRRFPDAQRDVGDGLGDASDTDGELWDDEVVAAGRAACWPRTRAEPLTRTPSCSRSTSGSTEPVRRPRKRPFTWWSSNGSRHPPARPGVRWTAPRSSTTDPWTTSRSSRRPPRPCSGHPCAPGGRASVSRRGRPGGAGAPGRGAARELEESARRLLDRGDAGGAIAAFHRSAVLTPPGPVRAHRAARAAYMDAAVGGDLGAAPTQLRGPLWATAARGHVLLHGDGDLDAAHRLLVDAAVAVGADPETEPAALTAALDTLFVACRLADRPALWPPLRALIAVRRPCPAGVGRPGGRAHRPDVGRARRSGGGRAARLVPARRRRCRAVRLRAAPGPGRRADRRSGGCGGWCRRSAHARRRRGRPVGRGGPAGWEGAGAVCRPRPRDPGGAGRGGAGAGLRVPR